MPQCSSGHELVVISSGLAIAISERFNTDQINLLANFFNALGENLALIAAQQDLCDTNK